MSAPPHASTKMWPAPTTMFACITRAMSRTTRMTRCIHAVRASTRMTPCIHANHRPQGPGPVSNGLTTLFFESSACGVGIKRSGALL